MLRVAMWIASAAFLLRIAPAKAEVVHSYAENDFVSIGASTPRTGAYTTSMRDKGLLTLANAELPRMVSPNVVPFDFSFNDERNSISVSPTADFVLFQLARNAVGQTGNWAVFHYPIYQLDELSAEPDRQ